MIPLDEDQPFIENPNPRFGAVLSKLNELRYFVEDKTANYNGNTTEKLAEFTRNLQSFVTDVVVPIDNHINAKGAVHNENKATVGLSQKDNYPAATLQQQLNLEDVNAFVTAQGAKQAVDANPPNYNPDWYQKNDVLRLASYYFPDEYPTLIPTVPQPVRYLPNAKSTESVGIILNNDRMLYATWQDTAVYQRNSMFLSGPTKIFSSVSATEIQNVNVSYKAKGWGHRTGVGSDSKVNLFHPLTDKKIYGYKNSLTLPASDMTSYLVYNSFVGATYKGIGVSVTMTGTKITVNHRFFKVDKFNTDPTLINVVDTSYLADFELMAGKSTAAAQGNHLMDILDFIQLPAGATVSFGGNLATPNCSLVWGSQDAEALLLIALGITVKYADNTLKYHTLNIVETITPGALRAGGKALFKVTGSVNKDIFPETKVDPTNPQWTTPSNPWDVNSTVHTPGIVLDDGTLVKAKTTKYSLKIKRYGTGFDGMAGWLTGPRPQVDMNRGSLTTTVPARHNVFSPLPERIIPIRQDEEETVYLVYGLNAGQGRYYWHEYTWIANGVVGLTLAGQTALNQPTKEIRYEGLTDFPAGITCLTTTAAGAITLGALVFTKANVYTGAASISYTDGVVTLGSAVKLAPISMTTLTAMISGVLSRAKTRNPSINDSLREGQVMVYGLPGNKALYLITDGISSVEGGVVPYTITGGVLTLDFTKGTGGVPVLLGNNTVAEGTSRTSRSGDGVQLDFTDLFVRQVSADEYTVIVNRPFGALYGDVSFSVTAYTQAKPTLTPRVVNSGRLYHGVSAIDVVDELYPCFAIPGRGVYQYAAASTGFETLCRNVNLTTDVIDPYNLNDASYVFVPAGAKVILAGRSYALNTSYPVKVDATGVTYCYLAKTGDTLVVIASKTLREPSNNEVMFGVATNGILKMLTSYLVIDGRVVTATRQGSAIPYFADDGANGTNKFFTRRDRI